MSDIGTLAGWGSLVLTVVGYVPYIVSVIRRRTRPHAFSWFLWALIGGIVFFGQHVAGAGPEAWATGLSMVFCVFIFLLALFQGDVRFTRVDGALLGTSLVAVALWVMTKDPTASVVLVTLANALGGHTPTILKAWSDPWRENLLPFMMGIPKYGLALAALETINLTTVCYPVTSILMNSALIAVVVVRRRQVRRTSP